MRLSGATGGASGAENEHSSFPFKTGNFLPV